MSDSITKAKKQRSLVFPRAKIQQAVRSAVPLNRDFTLHVAKSNFGDAKIVRIVTEAWKTKRPADRIFKVLTAVNKRLSEQERQSVLRFSVLTNEEYKSVMADK